MNIESTELLNAREDFIEKMGVIVQRENLPRIAGRILGVLIFDARPIGFGELAEGLEVSRGSVSASVRLLEERGLIRRIGQHGHRGDFFVMAEDAHANMLRGVKSRAALAEQEIKETVQMVPADHCDLRSRLEGFTNFYSRLIESIDVALERVSRCGQARNVSLAERQASGVDNDE